MGRYNGIVAYEAISPIKDSHNRTIGYLIKSTDGNQFEASSSQIKQSISNGTSIKGLKLSSDGRLIRDNATIGISLSASHQVQLASELRVLTGKTLESYVASARRFRPRDYVQSIVNYITNDDYFRVFIVHGIRRTGKTVSLLHSIDAYRATSAYKEHPQDIVFMTLTSDITFETLASELLKYNNCVLFVDEITRVTDILAHASYLSDVLCISNNIKLIISGTDSFVFTLALVDALYGRAYIARSTYLSYKEYVRLFSLEKSQSSYKQYRARGAVYSADFNKLDKALNSINFAIIRNIYNTINRNKEHLIKDGTYGELLRFNEHELEYLIYNVIITATSPKSLNKLSASLSNLGKAKRKLIAQYCNVADSSVVRSLSAVQNTTVVLFPQVLEDLDIIRRYPNIAYYAIDDGDRRFKGVTDQELGITIPALLNSMLTVRQASDDSIIGIENENTILTSIKFELNNNIQVLDIGYMKYRGSEGEHEVDAVVKIEELDGTRGYVLVEVKSSLHADLSYAKHLVTTDMPASIFKAIRKRIVIYNGENTVKHINGYGIHYINIIDFLMDIEGYVLK